MFTFVVMTYLYFANPWRYFRQLGLDCVFSPTDPPITAWASAFSSLFGPRRRFERGFCGPCGFRLVMSSPLSSCLVGNTSCHKQGRGQIVEFPYPTEHPKSLRAQHQKLLSYQYYANICALYGHSLHLYIIIFPQCLGSIKEVLFVRRADVFKVNSGGGAGSVISPMGCCWLGFLIAAVHILLKCGFTARIHHCEMWPACR